MSIAVAAPSLAELELATLRLAIHEAGHAVAAVLLGHRVDGLTIEVDEGESGCCFWSSEPPPKLSLETAGSVLLSDWKVRQRLEQRLVVSLVGIIAVEVWAPREPGYQPRPASDLERERLTAELEAAGLGEQIESFEATPPLERQTDEDRIFRLARLGSSGLSTAAAFLAWVVAEVTAWVASEPFHRALAPLAEELLRHGSLPGKRVHEIVDQTQAEIKAALNAYRQTQGAGR